MEFTKEDIFLVSGASSGIGQGVAIKLIQEGATVIATGRSLEKLEETKKLCNNSENIFLEPKNLTENIDELPFWVKVLKEKYGKLRGLICCAGIIDVKPLQMLEEMYVKKLFDINYFVPVFLAKGFADKRNNIGQGSSITFIASIAAILGDKGQIAYGGSKAALITSAKSMSHELASRKIRVNTISPGDIDTPMNKQAIEEYNHTTSERYTYGIGSVEDIANMTAFLVSDKARWITGQNYIMDGGYI